jgi:hypothetical protein
MAIKRYPACDQQYADAEGPKLSRQHQCSQEQNTQQDKKPAQLSILKSHKSILRNMDDPFYAEDAAGVRFRASS